MTLEKIKAAYEARPFRPFTLHLADGRTFPVNHPEFMALLPGGRTVFVALEEGPYDVIDILMIVSLGFDRKRRRGGGGGNGRGGKRRAA